MTPRAARPSRQPASHVERAAAGLLARSPRVLLAVSGGVDSMVLMHAVTRRREPHHHIVVATFDHGTGQAAARAASLVRAEASRLGLPVRDGVARIERPREAEWRAARWSFLRAMARLEQAPVVTAHTEDDQLETIVMRLLRHAGARGLAGLYAGSDVQRPFLGLSKAALLRYAEQRRVAFVSDPTNTSRAHLRNRVRLDILPALLRVRPGIGAELLAIARRAAQLRADIEREAERFVEREGAGTVLRVARQELASYDSEALRVLWPAVAARAGVVLDRRGNERLASFTREAQPGGRIQLSGGFEVIRDRETFRLRRVRLDEAPRTNPPLHGVVAFGPWRFTPASPTHAIGPWCSELPADRALAVRAWQPGDRLRLSGSASPRRVKRFFADARVAGPDREGWPVVVAGEEIVWIPGIRRSDAATARPGGPVVRYMCERIDS